ncbi:hypothetical protein GC174_15415 [bacterium]|nr:hypothetical protein [bacterium]
MDIYEQIDNMRTFVKDADWAALEEEYEALARKLAGDEYAQKVSNLDFSSYMEGLEEALSEAVSLAKSVNAKAIHFEYNLDNDWESTFYVCSDYSPESEEDDDWASDYEDAISGPSFPQACAIYQAKGFDTSEEACGVTLYLIARTLSAFGEILEKFPLDIAICAGFQDQDPLMRLQEPKS